MRLSIYLKIISENPALPPYYRIGFASLIKECLKQADKSLYNTYYSNNFQDNLKTGNNPKSESNKDNINTINNSKNIPKPFTFAVKLPVNRIESKNNNKNYGKDNRSLILNNGVIELFFSSNDYRFIFSIYNGIMKVKKYNIYGLDVEYEKAILHQDLKFEDGKVNYKVFSPIVVRKVDDLRKGLGYCSIKDNDYKKMLFYNIKSMTNFLEEKIEINEDNIEFDISRLFEVKIPNYNKSNRDKPEIIIASDGYITIKAPKKIHELIYYIGLGARRSQGFGMLEVETEGNEGL